MFRTRPKRPLVDKLVGLPSDIDRFAIWHENGLGLGRVEKGPPGEIYLHSFVLHTRAYVLESAAEKFGLTRID